MERIITYEGERWRVWVNPLPAGRDSQSGLELVFTHEAGEQRVASPMSQALLLALSREGLELDEGVLREELRRALQQAPVTGRAPATGRTPAAGRARGGEHGGEDGEQ